MQTKRATNTIVALFIFIFIYPMEQVDYANESAGTKTLK